MHGMKIEFLGEDAQLGLERLKKKKAESNGWNKTTIYFYHIQKY